MYERAEPLRSDTLASASAVIPLVHAARRRLMFLPSVLRPVMVLVRSSAITVAALSRTSCTAVKISVRTCAWCRAACRSRLTVPRLLTLIRCALAWSPRAAAVLASGDHGPYAGSGDRVWQLRGILTSYDASYVALAELLGATLVTLDKRLARAPGTHCAIAAYPGPS